MTTRRKALLALLSIIAVLTITVAGALPASAQQGPQLRVTDAEYNDQPDPAVDSNGNVHIAFIGYPCTATTYQTFGTSPDRHTVIQWDTFHYTDGDPGLFQAVLWENGDIHINVEDATGAQLPIAKPPITGVNQDDTDGVDIGFTPGDNSSFDFTWNGFDDYNWSSGEARWVDASGGTLVPACKDDSSGAVPIGFDFTFYGTSYDTVYVSSNGYMSFNDTDPTSPYGPDPADFPSGYPDAANVIAPLWADWTPEYGQSDEPEICYAMLDGETGAPLIAPTQLSESDDENSNRPSIGVDSQDNVHIVWHDRASNEVMYTKLDPGLDDQNGGPALDAAITLEPDRAITSLNATDVAANPRIAIDSNDDIHVVWEEWSERLEVYYMKVDGNGGELVAPRVIGIPSVQDHSRALPQIALDSEDNAHVAFVGCGCPVSVTYQTFGTSPNMYTVIQWDTFTLWGSSGPGEFQAVLHEGGNISINIADSTGVVDLYPVTGVNLNSTHGVDVGEYPPDGWSSYRFTWNGSDYDWDDIAYSWIDASGGTPVLACGDDISGAVLIGFDFTFYGTSYGTVYVSDNGYMSFTDTDPTESDNPSAFPSGDSEAADVIAPLWEDWYSWHEVSYTMLDGATGDFLIAPTIVSDVEDADSKRPSISVDDEDRVHIVWMDSRGQVHEVFYTKLDPALDDRDGSCVDEAAITLIDDKELTPDDGVSSLRPTSEIGCGRYIHVTWHEKYDKYNYDLHYMVLDKDGSTVVDDTPLTTTGKATTSTKWTNAFLDVDSQDRAHITWCDYRDGEDQVYYTTYQGPPCEQPPSVGGVVEPVDPLELGAISGEPSNGASNIPAIALGIGITALIIMAIAVSALMKRKRVE